MTALVITRGLPGSGKTTWAKQWVTEGEKRVRLNRDDFRLMLFNKRGGQLTGEQETAVTTAQQAAARDFLRKGYSVVADDTNLRSQYARRWAQIAAQTGAQFIVNDDFLSVPLGECIVRDSQRENAVGHTVIEDMHRRYLNAGPLQPVAVEPSKPLTAFYVPDESLRPAFIVDIDGTLADKHPSRDIYDLSKVHLDLERENVSYVVRELARKHAILIVSGRSDDSREVTEKWLNKRGITNDGIYMRESGDFRDDAIVKAEIFDKYIRNDFWVRGVFDDRDRVVRMWRSIGLDCFQVNYGDF